MKDQVFSHSLLIHSPNRLVPKLTWKMATIIPSTIVKANLDQKQKRFFSSCMSRCYLRKALNSLPVLGKEASLKEEALAGKMSLSWPRSGQGIPMPTVRICPTAAMPHLTPSPFTVWSGLPRYTTEGKSCVLYISAHNWACCLAPNRLKGTYLENRGPWCPSCLGYL